MHISFHGAARTVTGSQHLITVNGRRLLLDCGLYQGHLADMLRRNKQLPFEASSIDALVLSHAHLDHCGNIPNLVRQGFGGRIHATPATVDLARLIMLDSGKIHESDAAHMTRKNARRGLPPIEPLYTVDDAQAAMGAFDAHALGSAFSPLPGVTVTLQPAGHILGAASVVVDLEEAGNRRRLVFSGDLGRFDIPLLVDPTIHDAVDVLVLESTYGDRLHAAASDAYGRFGKIVRETAAREGKVIIPSFALGRAQDLIYALHRMMDAGEVPRIPVFLDSPLSARITAVYQAHSSSFDAETRTYAASDPHQGPLSFPEVRVIEATEESKALNGRPGPMVIISASGMATSGRIQHHLANNVGDARNTVVIVSWQAPGTPGRRLVEREPRIRLLGDEVDVRCQVEVINGLSAHADQAGLADYAAAMSASLRGVFLVHGEMGPAFGLAEVLHERGVNHVAVPMLDEVVELP